MGNIKSMLSPLKRTQSYSFSLFLCIFSQSKTEEGKRSGQKFLEGGKIQKILSCSKDLLFLPMQDFYFQKSSKYVFTHALNNPYL